MTAEPAPDVWSNGAFCAEANPLAPELLCSLLPHDPKTVEHSSNGSTWPAIPTPREEDNR